MPLQSRLHGIVMPQVLLLNLAGLARLDVEPRKPVSRRINQSSLPPTRHYTGTSFPRSIATGLSSRKIEVERKRSPCPCLGGGADLNHRPLGCATRIASDCYHLQRLSLNALSPNVPPSDLLANYIPLLVSSWTDESIDRHQISD